MLSGAVTRSAISGKSSGFPVALKLDSPDILHKTEAGVVRLNLGDAAQVRTAFAEILASAKCQGLFRSPPLDGGAPGRPPSGRAFRSPGRNQPINRFLASLGRAPEQGHPKPFGGTAGPDATIAVRRGYGVSAPIHQLRPTLVRPRHRGSRRQFDASQRK
jgi:hypothetical protein